MDSWNETERLALVANLFKAWRKYTLFFSEPPHGTEKQISAMTELMKDKSWGRSLVKDMAAELTKSESEREALSALNAQMREALGVIRPRVLEDSYAVAAIDVALSLPVLPSAEVQTAKVQVWACENHDWYCGCGHWNGSELATCAACTRPPGGWPSEFHIAEPKGE